MSGNEKTGQKSVLERIDNAIHSFMNVFAWVCVGILLMDMLLLFFDMVFSKIFHSSIEYVSSICKYGNVPLVLLGTGLVELDGGHTTIELLYGSLPDTAKKVTWFITKLITIFVTFLLAYLGFRYAGEMFRKGDVSNVTYGFPLWPFAACLGLGWGLYFLASVWNLIRTVAGLYKVPGLGLKNAIEMQNEANEEEPAAFDAAEAQKKAEAEERERLRTAKNDKKGADGK